jgi:hypothetical protein
MLHSKTIKCTLKKNQIQLHKKTTKQLKTPLSLFLQVHSASPEPKALYSIPLHFTRDNRA